MVPEAPKGIFIVLLNNWKTHKRSKKQDEEINLTNAWRLWQQPSLQPRPYESTAVTNEFPLRERPVSTYGNEKSYTPSKTNIFNLIEKVLQRVEGCLKTHTDHRDSVHLMLQWHWKRLFLYMYIQKPLKYEISCVNVIELDIYIRYHVAM